MNLERIIFGIDKPEDIYHYAHAVQHLNQLEAMGKISMCIPCIGSFEGKLEPSFMVYAKEFDKHIRGEHYIQEQESIMRIPGDDRQECTLEFLSNGDQLPIGRLTNIKDYAIARYDSWTYVIEAGRYFTTVKD